MIEFVNAKINIGLFVTERRPDGYHNLSTVFYPVGRHSGLPENPTPFCDILEISPSVKTEFTQSGRAIDCPKEKNLVWKAIQAYAKAIEQHGKSLKPSLISLYKALPDGAGMGGGSADASFTLKLLNNFNNDILTRDELLSIARALGADCPFFLINKPVYAEGIGDIFTPIKLDLNGYYLLLLKPEESISTREAFSFITPRKPQLELKNLIEQPISQWHKNIKNDFEDSFFNIHPHLKRLKTDLYSNGALYASMSGSGSTFYGIFNSFEAAQSAHNQIPCFYKRVIKL